MKLKSILTQIIKEEVNKQLTEAEFSIDGKVPKWTSTDTLSKKSNELLDKVVEGTWKQNSDGSYDVNGNVDLTEKNLTKLPFKFNKVSGWFYCSYNKLTTLEGAPKEVGGGFYCDNNKLPTLEGAPTKVIRGGFYCGNNKLTTLKGAPTEVGGTFHCTGNKKQFTEDEVKEVSNVSGTIYV